MNILVYGAGGFIGSSLVKILKAQGNWVRGVDIKKPEFSDTQADEFILLDLRNPRNVESSMRLNSERVYSDLPLPFEKQIPFDEVYQLAADMGGAGYIFTGEHDADVMSNSALINLNTCSWATIYKVGKIFYSSSACMYPQEIQNSIIAPLYGYSLKESDVYPANPDSEYGWEKLFSERLYLAYQRNYGLNVRIARFHNIYGPEGTYKGGKEKAPAAMCRKVIESENGTISIWGDGKQTRSFLYIDDCLDAVQLLMASDFKEPINIGSEEMVTIDELAIMAHRFSNKAISIKHIDGPTGVRGRNSDNTLIRKVLNWEPKFSLKNGLERTYTWIKSEYDRD